MTEPKSEMGPKSVLDPEEPGNKIGPRKWYAWAYESRADLCPLRFSAIERSGVGSESG